MLKYSTHFYYGLNNAITNSKKIMERRLVTFSFLFLGIILLQSQNTAAESAAPLKHREISTKKILNCRDYTEGKLNSQRNGASGSINNPEKSTGVYFNYIRGRLYYRSCHSNLGQYNERSFGFVEWESMDGNTNNIVTLITKLGFCFRGSSFSIKKNKLVTTLLTCDGKSNKDGYSTLEMRYQWKGDKLGNGNFQLVKQTFKK